MITSKLSFKDNVLENLSNVQQASAERTQSALFHFFCKCTTHESGRVWHALALYCTFDWGMASAELMLLLNPQLPNCTVAPFLTKPFPANAWQSYQMSNHCADIEYLSRKVVASRAITSPALCVFQSNFTPNPLKITLCHSSSKVQLPKPSLIPPTPAAPSTGASAPRSPMLLLGR